MHRKTIAEKILSRAAGKSVQAGEIAICTPDLAMGTDGSIPMALDYLEAIRPEAVPCAPQRLVFALDHYGPASGAKAQALQQRARAYAWPTASPSSKRAKESGTSASWSRAERDRAG